MSMSEETTMTEAVNPTVAAAAERDSLKEYWLGRQRYFKVEGDERVYFPEYMYHDWYTPDDVFREVCVALNEHNAPVWRSKEDAPAPAEYFRGDGSGKSSYMSAPAAEAPPFDYTPPAYASDRFSGGPSNFDQKMGGDDNPRNPLLEGEEPGRYQAEMDEFKAKMDALKAEIDSLKAEKNPAAKATNKKAPAKGVEGLKELINGKPE
jgi:hypothetical protein